MRHRLFWKLNGMRDRLQPLSARTEHWEPPGKPVKPPRPKAVGMGTTGSAEEGAEDLEQAGNAVIEVAEDPHGVVAP